MFEPAIDALIAWRNSPYFRPVVGLVVALAALNLFAWAVQRAIKRSGATREGRYRLAKTVRYGAAVLGIILILLTFSNSLGEFGVVFGVAGAGLAFALQEVIASIAGWVALSFGGFFGIGDRVQLGGTKGDVIDIGVLRTTVMEIGDWVASDNYNGRIVRIANSFVFKEPVYNYSADFPFLWDEISVPVHFDSDWSGAAKLILEEVTALVSEYTTQSKANWRSVVKKYYIEDARIEPSVTIRFDSNFVTISAHYIVDFQSRRSVRSQISEAILKALQGHEPPIKIGSTTLELVKG